MKTTILPDLGEMETAKLAGLRFSLIGQPLTPIGEYPKVALTQTSLLGELGAVLNALPADTPSIASELLTPFIERFRNLSGASANAAFSELLKQWRAEHDIPMPFLLSKLAAMSHEAALICA